MMSISSSFLMYPRKFFLKPPLVEDEAGLGQGGIMMRVKLYIFMLAYVL
jgi:hypothetical protein